MESPCFEVADLQGAAIAALIFALVHVASALLSSSIFPQNYGALTSKERQEWHGRVVGTTFAFAVMVFAAPEYFSPGPALAANHCLGRTPRSQMVSWMGVGFFSWDAIFCNIISPQQVAVRMHSVIGLLLMVFTLQPFMHYGLCFIVLWEASTPFLNLRMQLITCGKADTAAFHIANVTFAVLFIGVRWGFGLPGSYRWYVEAIDQYHTGQCGDTDSWLLTVTFGYYMVAPAMMNLLNILWGIKILQGVKKVIIGEVHSTKKAA